MSIEKSKEQMMNTNALSDEELEQVNGGSDGSSDASPAAQQGAYAGSPCPKCGKGQMVRFYYPGGSYLRCMDGRSKNGEAGLCCGWSIDEKTGLPAIGG